jgi:hypothetical protein
MQSDPIILMAVIYGFFVIIGAMAYSIATAESPSSQSNLPDAFLRVLAGNPNLNLHAGSQLAQTIKL